MEREQKTCARDTSSDGDTKARASRIRALNDQLRKTGLGGRMMITSGVQELGAAVLAQVLDALRNYDAFSADNDPYHEHDLGGFSCCGHRLLFKIDYYDAQLEYGSPDPADPDVTTRVLTVMLAEEY